MIWALLLGAAVGLASARWNSSARLSVPDQFFAAAILQPALLLFVSKLGLMVGSALPKLASAGWALAFQEFGHFVGTILLGLPLALLLGIKREAIGATFSVGREPSLAIIGEKYGMDSAEGRGVLAEYLTGTVFGAVFIAVFAGFVSSLGIFDPLALAMGSGVGSGSMMAAASGAIAAQQDPETAKSVLAFAAASNLITTTIGTYFTLFISLPLAVWGYRVLEPLIGRTTKASAQPETASPSLGEVRTEAPTLGYGGKLLAWIVTAAMALVCDWIAHGTTPLVGLPGIAIMVVATIVGDALARVTGRRIPAVCWVSVGGDVPDLAVEPVGLADRRAQLAQRFPRRDHADAGVRRAVDRQGHSRLPPARLAHRAGVLRGERRHLHRRDPGGATVPYLMSRVAAAGGTGRAGAAVAAAATRGPTRAFPSA